MDDPRPLVAVFLGTDHHPFDRLVRWAAGLEERAGVSVHVQHGSTTLPPGLPGASMLAPEPMDDLLHRASAVITHAGPGSIMDARDHGHVPIVVPRDPHLGEHVDDHQLRFARFIARSGAIMTAYDEDELAARVRMSVLVGRPRTAVVRPTATLDRFEQLIDRLVRR
ncbi:glycosyltransferase [Nocardioides sp. Root190]|uniref:glycosyltransferase n=1 Tax=Nocardioides sp. Root190 TaxID=1736488 RepID=UPI000AC48077|nr:glycosyltransferase [Nocardioides sp. Root190]